MTVLLVGEFIRIEYTLMTDAVVHTIREVTKNA